MSSKNTKAPVKVTLKPVVLPGDPPYTTLLVDPSVDAAVCGTLAKMGWPQQDLCNGLQEVRFLVIRAFRRGKPPPPTVGEMTAYCVVIARNYAIKVYKKEASATDRGDAGLCEDPDEYACAFSEQEQRDPVDAQRQLELVADLFRQGKMPEHGLDILEGIASGCGYQEVADSVGISSFAVQSRLKAMRRRFQKAYARNCPNR